MSTEIIVAVLSLAGVLGAAVIAWMGRRDETTANASETLITGQATRIDKLETRLDSVEADLRATRVELQEIQSHAGELRDALRRALAWIAEALEHLASPGSIAPPHPPDLETWQALVDSPPRARNPPARGSAG